MQQEGSDLLSNIINGLANGVGGAAIGGIAGYFLARKQQRRKEIEYAVSSIPLIGLTPSAQRRLNVTVDKSVLTDDLKDKGIPIQVNNAYAFELTLKNSGNEDIEKPNIEIALDDSAKIVEFETQPESRPDYQIVKNKLKPHVLYVQFPYINKDNSVSITVISVDNVSRETQVDIRGMGIKSYSTRNIRRFAASDVFSIVLDAFAKGPEIWTKLFWRSF